MNTRLRSLLAVLGIAALLMPGVYLAFRPLAAVEATGIPVVKTFGFPEAIKWGVEAIFFGLENIGYQWIKQQTRTYAHNIAIQTFGDFASGGKGQEPLVQQESLEDYLKKSPERAASFFLEGAAQSIEESSAKFNQENRVASSTAGWAEEGRDFKEKCPILTFGGESVMMYEQVLSKQRAGTPLNVAEQNCLDAADEAKTAQKNAQAETAELSRLRRSEVTNRQKYNEGAVGGMSPVAKELIGNICNPNGLFKLKLLVGLGIGPAPAAAPMCDLKKAWEDWGKLVKKTGITGDVSGWKVLKDMLDPTSSDIGIAYEAHTAFFADKQEKFLTDLFGRQDEGAVKHVTSLSGLIKTPSEFLRQQGQAVADNNMVMEARFTGKLAADLGDLVTTFLSTLASKSQSLLLKGITDRAAMTGIGSGETGSFQEGTGSGSIVYDRSGIPSYSGQKAAAVRTAELAKIELSGGGQLNIMSELQSENKMLPHSRTMGRAFGAAVQKKMTVQEAMDRYVADQVGINPAARFGFSTAGDQGGMDWRKDIPYSSLVILRKYRVIPVSWELAALYIKANPKICNNQDCTIKYITEHFTDSESPFYGLIDPNWVLKLPAVSCALKGFGPVTDRQSFLCVTDTNGDGMAACTLQDRFAGDKDNLDAFNANPSATRTVNGITGTSTAFLDTPIEAVTRQEICLDERSCLEDDKDGKCEPQKEGYCLEEQRVWQFKGSECSNKYASCDALTDTETKQKSLFLKDSVAAWVASTNSTNVCAAESAGCRWYSKERNVGAALQDTVTNTKKDWSSAASSKVMLTSKALSCTAAAEGCRALTDTVAMRLAPDYYRCSEIIDGKPGYRREECKRFALHCEQKYRGCEQYTPTAKDDPVVAGVVGSTDACVKECVGLTSFVKSSTPFENAEPSTGAVLAFIPSSKDIRQCSSSDIGCDEFTNLDASVQSGESKEYFTQLQACEKKPKNPTLFYTFFGSDTTGFQLEKVYLKADESGHPVCATDRSGSPEPCVCSKDIFDEQKSKPRTGFFCREFINPNNPTGNTISYRYTDKVVYQADDCHPYRRTLDGASGHMYYATPSKSGKCSASAAGCREYKDPSAGNYAVIEFDTFDKGTTDNWIADSSATTASPSNVGEVLGSHSLLAEQSSTSSPAATLGVQKLVDVRKGFSYELTFGMKGPSGSKVKAKFIKGIVEQQLNDATLNGEWQYVKLFIPENTIESGAKNTLLVLTVEKASASSFGEVAFDNIALKELTGVVYALKQSISLPSECSDVAANLSCRLYRDRKKQEVALRSFTRLCPTELLGCNGFDKDRYSITLKDTNNTIGTVYGRDPILRSISLQTIARCRTDVNPVVWDAAPWPGYNSTGFFAAQSGDPYECYDEYVPSGGSDHLYAIYTRGVYFVNDSAKHCRVTDNGCTAYGKPALAPTTAGEVLLTRDIGRGKKEEVWKTTYYKISPETIQLHAGGLGTGDATSTKLAYEAGVCKQTDLGCRAYAAAYDKKTFYFKDPAGQVCTPNETAQEEISFDYRLCKKKDGTNTNRYCTADKECQDLDDGSDGVCTKIQKCEGVNSPIIKSCPAKNAGCRTINDPACVQLKRCKGKTTACKTDAECVARYPSLSSAHTCEPVPSQFTFESDYYGLGTRGQSCEPTYTFLPDLKEAGNECRNGVNVAEGCLLFQDANANGGAARYNATTFYSSYWSPGTRQSVPLTEDASLNPAPLTTNVLMKVSRNRQCKTWLACTDYENVGKDEEGRDVVACTKRAPCARMSESGRCLEWLYFPTKSTTFAKRDVPQLRSLFDVPFTQIKNGVATSSLNFSFASLSGLSRPDFSFSATTLMGSGGQPVPSFATTGGHDGYFDWLQERTLPDTDPNARFSTDNRLNIGHPAFLAALPAGLTASPIVNSCRLHPGADAAELWGSSASPQPKDACNYTKDDKIYRGIKGFCLEPFPLYSSPLSSNQYGSTKNDPAVFGYKNFCLNWYPIDYPKGQSPAAGLIEVPASLPLTSGGNSVDVHYCSAKTNTAWTLTVPGSRTHIYETAEVTRDSRVSNAGRGMGRTLEIFVTPFLGSVYAAGGVSLVIIKSTLDSYGAQYSCPIVGGTCENPGAVEARSAAQYVGDVINTIGQGAVDTIISGGLSSMVWLKRTATSADSGLRHPSNWQSALSDFFIIYAEDLWNGDDVTREVNARSNEEISRGSINSIEYSVSWASHQSEFTKQYGDGVGPQNKVNNLSDDESLTFLMRDDRAGQGSPVNHANAFSVSCDNYRDFIVIKPIFTNGILDKWKWRYCDDDGSDGVEFSLITIKIHKVRYEEEPITRNYGRDYCTEVVRVSSDQPQKGTIPSRSGWNGNLNNLGPTAFPVLDTTLPRIFSQTDDFSSPASTAAGITVSGSTITYNPIKTDEGGGIIVPQCSGAVCANWLGRALNSKQYVTQNISNNLDTLGYFPAVSARFARKFGHWTWVSSGTAPNGSYVAQGSLETTTPLNWSGAGGNKETGALNPPVFVSKTKTNGEFSWSFGSENTNTLTIEFFLNVHANQVPVRYLEIDWHDGEIKREGDKGIIGLGHMPRQSEPGTQTYSYTHTYDPDELLDSKQVCVSATDNWEATATLCGTIHQATPEAQPSITFP